MIDILCYDLLNLKTAICFTSGGDGKKKKRGDEKSSEKGGSRFFTVLFVSRNINTSGQVGEKKTVCRGFVEIGVAGGPLMGGRGPLLFCWTALQRKKQKTSQLTQLN